MAARANQMPGRLKDTLTYMNTEMFIGLYTSLVRSLMEHTIQPSSLQGRKDIKKLEKVQRRDTELVPCLTHLPYEEGLIQLSLITLETQQTRDDMLEVFKILKASRPQFRAVLSISH